MTNPPAGWYPNPEQPGEQRYWDGDQWTEHTAAASPQPAGWGAPPTWGGGTPGSAAQPYGYYPQQRVGTNGLAITSLVLGIVWVWWIGSILAVIFGFIALRQIDDSGGAQQGRGMAIAGIVLGFIGVGILLLVMLFGFLGAATSSGF